MIISFSDLKDYDFELSGINIIYQKPIYRKLNNSCRIPNGFLIITKGNCTYTSEAGIIELSPGSVVYLPKGSNHKLFVSTEEFEFYRVDFNIMVNNEFVLFSTLPLLITDAISGECLNAVETLLENYQFVNNTIAKAELMLKIFRLLQVNTVSKRVKKLSPAVDYISEHPTENISCKQLAQMCYLSTAQFYKLFSDEYGCTPLEYRNRLIIAHSKTLLESGEFTVTEVAETLKFESVAYFSRFFKKHTGVSPKNYITF